jgi:asparagine synthase (glutamine-hydrolysing)
LGAIYGILGACDVAELAALGDRLGHRGAGRAEWRVSPTLYLGQRFQLARPQPAAEGRLVTLDAAIDNLTELAELLGRPTDAVAVADTADLILELYRNSGPEAFKLLKGPFAIALWDDGGRQLVFARDFWALRSLYFVKLQDRVAFASEYKALLALSQLVARPARDIIQHVNATHAPHQTASCLEGVKLVPPGHWLSLTDAEVRAERFLRPQVHVPARSDEEHIRDFRDSFLSVVRRQLTISGRVGIAVSGGVDAAAVVAAIRHVAPERDVQTFCAGFGPEDPEIVGGEETARHFGTRHHSVHVPASALPSILPLMMWHTEDPGGREDILTLFASARAAAGKVDTLFGGHLADVCFGGMPRHQLARLAHRLPLAVGPLQDLYRYTRTGQAPATRVGRLLLKLYFSDGICPPPRVLGAKDLSPAIADTDMIPEIARLRASGDHPLSEFLLSAILIYQGKSHYDRAHAAFGVELNSPFTDPEMMRCALRIPDHLKIHGRIQKYVERKALSDLLPTRISQRKKSLAKLKHDQELADTFEHLAELLLSPAAVRERALFQARDIERIKRRPLGRPYPKEQLYRLWGLILSEIWCRIFIDRRGAFPSDPLW